MQCSSEIAFRRNGEVGLEQEIAKYLAGAEESGEDLRLAMLAILMERYAKRIPQRGLFDEANNDAEPNRPLTVDASIADGARIHSFTGRIDHIILVSIRYAMLVRKTPSNFSSLRRGWCRNPRPS